jgi:hypothetical protein
MYVFVEKKQHPGDNKSGVLLFPVTTSALATR